MVYQVSVDHNDCLLWLINGCLMWMYTTLRSFIPSISRNIFLRSSERFTETTLSTSSPIFGPPQAGVATQKYCCTSKSPTVKFVPSRIGSVNSISIPSVFARTANISKVDFSLQVNPLREYHKWPSWRQFPPEPIPPAYKLPSGPQINLLTPASNPCIKRKAAPCFTPSTSSINTRLIPP